MIDLFAVLQSLSLPMGAGADSPAIVIGPNIPAEIVTKYTPDVVVAIIMERVDSTHYQYQALVSIDPNLYYVAYGRVIPGPTVRERLRLDTFGISFGSTDGLTAQVGGPFAASDSTLQLYPNADFVVDGVSQPRGSVCFGATNVNSLAFGAEGVAMTTSTGDFPDGRVFKAIINAGYFGSVANNALIRIRKGTTTAGALLWLLRTPPLPLAAAAAQFPFEAIFMNNSGADITAQDLCVTIQASAGTVTQTATGNNQRYIDVINWGSTNQYGTGWLSL